MYGIYFWKLVVALTLPPPPPPPPNTIKTANEGRFRLNVDSPYGERAQSTVLTRAPPRRPARPRRDFIFNLSMRESKASPVVVCSLGGRRRFRLGVSSSVGHCCQHFWVGWWPNQIKGGLLRGKCQRDKQALQIFFVGFSWTTLMLCTRVPKTPRPSCGKSLFWMCMALVTSINMAGGASKCGVGSLVHRRKFDRSHSDVAVLCAAALVFPSLGQDLRNNQTNAGYPKDLVERSSLSFCCRELICDSEVRANRACPSKPPDKNQSITCKS